MVDIQVHHITYTIYKYILNIAIDIASYFYDLEIYSTIWYKHNYITYKFIYSYRKYTYYSIIFVELIHDSYKLTTLNGIEVKIILNTI